MPDSDTPCLGFLNRYLTFWILAAMALGITLGATIEGLPAFLDSLRAGTANAPIAVGPRLMIYPPLVNVALWLGRRLWRRDLGAADRPRHAT